MAPNAAGLIRLQAGLQRNLGQAGVEVELLVEEDIPQDADRFLLQAGQHLLQPRASHPMSLPPRCRSRQGTRVCQASVKPGAAVTNTAAARLPGAPASVNGAIERGRRAMPRGFAGPPLNDPTRSSRRCPWPKGSPGAVGVG
jgi:hypothetical protein